MEGSLCRFASFRSLSVNQIELEGDTNKIGLAAATLLTHFSHEFRCCARAMELQMQKCSPKSSRLILSPSQENERATVCIAAALLLTPVGGK